MQQLVQMITWRGQELSSESKTCCLEMFSTVKEMSFIQTYHCHIDDIGFSLIL